jgi:hypothetical protein
MSLNIENAPAIAAAAAVGAVLPLSQRVEERLPGRDSFTPPKGLQGLAAAPMQDEGAPPLVLEDISFVERPIRDDAHDDRDDPDGAEEAAGPRVVAVLVDARAATTPGLQTLTVSQPATPSLPTAGAPDVLPAPYQLQQANTLLLGTVLPAPVQLQQAGLPVPAPVLQAPAPNVAPAMPGVPAPVTAESAVTKPAASPASAVPTPAGEATPSSAFTRAAGPTARGGSAQRDIAALRTHPAAGSAPAPTADRPADAPAPAEPVTRLDAGGTPGGQGDTASTLAASTREVASQQGEQRAGHEAGQARSHESAQTRRHVQHIQQAQQTNEMLARRSAAPEISYPFLTMGPGNSATIRLPPGQSYVTVLPSSRAVAQALSASPLPEGLDLRLAESTATEADSATDADERQKRQRGREHS